MQVLVVSNVKRDYVNFRSVQTLQNIEWDGIEALIYNSSKDSDVDTILELTRACNVVPKVIYINKQINSLFYGFFSGAKGDIYEDESLLEDEETLQFLIDDYKKTGMTVKAPNDDFETISTFIANVSKEKVENLEKLVKNNMVLQTLKMSVENVETALVRTDKANVGMVEMFNKTSEIIENLQEGQEKTSTEIAKLSQAIENIESKNIGGRSMNLFDFPTFQVPNTIPRVLYVKVYSPCMFLTSFLLAYQHYLTMMKQKSTKFLICVPKLKQYIKKYEQFTRLAMETINQRGIQNNSIFVTHEPKSQVLNAFFNMKSDIFIVVDMMFGDNLLAGAKIVQYNAISGMSDIKRYNLQVRNCIMPLSGYSNSIIIPKITSYSLNKTPDGKQVQTNDAQKKTKYYEACGERYKILDVALNLDK